MRTGRMVGWLAAALAAALALDPTSALAAPIDESADVRPAPATRLGTAAAVVPLGCVPRWTAADLDAFFSEALGPLQGFDNPKIIPLTDERHLWLLSDPYVDLTRSEAPPLQPWHYLHNTALIQDGTCFSLVQRMRGGHPVAFAGDLSDDDWFWPLGGEVGADGLLYVFWSQMHEDGPQAPEDGITRHPIATWLGVYDPLTLTPVRFGPAPNSGVHPQYGSAVQTVGAHSYLFGNSNLLQLSREGGLWSGGPFSARRMHLARVPAGRFLAEPEYFTGTGWSTDAEAAEPFLERWGISNAMQPRHIGGRWYSVVKKDEFWGHRLVVDRADSPQGPWTTIYDEPARPRVPAGSAAGITTYQPVLLPGLGVDGTLLVVLSQNGAQWSDALADPRLYRPQVIAVRR